MVYVLDDDRREEITAKLVTEFGEVEGVQRVITSEDFDEIGQSRPEDDSRAPDFWLAAESGYSFSESHAGEDVIAPRATPGGTHGYLPDQPDMLGTLVISGYGIEDGQTLGKVRAVDVAPTIAHLLGLEMPTAEGTALTAAFDTEE